MAGLIHVVLVHGTWADGVFAAVGDFLRRLLRLPARSRATSGDRYWYQDGHPFGRDLCARLAARGLQVEREEPLLWTGANSFRARFAAAADLAQRLERLHGRTLIVGHSHGGSVAMQAVKQLSPGRAQDVEVVTLSTPFVRAAASTSPHLAAAVAPAGMLVMVLGSALRARAAGVGVGDLLGMERFMATRFVPLLLLILLLFYLAFRLGTWFESQVVSPLATRFQGKRLHCLRGLSDEAGLAIAGGLIGAGISRLFISVIGLVTRHWLPAAALMLYAVVLLSAVFGVWDGAAFATFSIAVLDWTGRGLLGLWIVACAGNWFLGAEFALVGLLFMGALDSTPDAPAGTLAVETLPDAHGTLDALRHSALYLRPDIGEIIAAGVAPSAEP